MKRLSCVVLALGLCFLLVNTLRAQGFSVGITVTDGISSQVLTIGSDVRATSGIDSSLGEIEQPPIPPTGVFVTQLVSVPGQAELGQGTLVDLRHCASLYQSMTFKFKFRSAGDGPIGDSVILSWPSLKDIAGGYWVMVAGDQRYDMTKMTSITLPGEVGDPYGPGVTIMTGDQASYTTVTYARFYTDANASTGKLGQGNRATTKGVFYRPNVSDLAYEMGLKTRVKGIFEFYIGSITPRRVFIKKYPDLLKAAYARAGLFIHSSDSIFCLASFPHTVKGKSYPGFPVIANPDKGSPEMITKDSLNRVGKLNKEQTKLDPTPGKMIQSHLFAQLMTLKFNLLASDVGKTPNSPVPLRNLVFTSDFAAGWEGKTVDQFVAHADSAFSCGFGTEQSTLAEVTNQIIAINNAFNKGIASGGQDNIQLDTLGKWLINPSAFPNMNNPTVGTRTVKGWIPLAEANILKRPEAGSAVPINSPSLADAETHPDQYRLEQNYPNPFNPTTTISFNLVADGLVTVRVFNMLGQEVGLLANKEEMSAGENEVGFDASNLASGVYFYRIQVSDIATGKVMFQDMKKMMLVK